MKKYIYLVLFGSMMTILFNACADELDIKPTSELENDFFDSEVRVQQGVGACYAAITNMYGPILDEGGIHRLLFLPADDITNQDAGNGDLEAFSGLNPSNGQVSTTWRRHYQLIYRTNFMLEKLEDPAVQALVRQDKLLDANKGEVLFLRAWCFYRLWDWFRKAPVQTKRISSIDDAILPPSEGFEMLDQAITDLELAAALLPDETYWSETVDRGRVFNESAYGLLVKCYVLRARYDNKNADDYRKAIAAFEKIRTRRLVHFLDNFDYHFENNAESLFEFQASHATNQDNAWLDNNFGGAVGQMGAMYHYWTEHWSNYASGIYGPTKKLIDAYEADDPRKEGTVSQIRTNVYGDVDEPVTWGWGKFDDYQIQKYVKPGRCWFEPTWGISSTNNTRLIRYGDVKLLAAEAYLQVGDSDKALAQVNDIRKRARESTDDGSVSSVPADLTSVSMDDIIHERFIELAAEEGIRWTDLRSWHVAGFINLGTWKAADFGYSYDAANFEFEVPKHLLFPIPQREMETNPQMATSGNNPGY
jgi:tetratricopeptide (TPR) repeat protein